ncbi:MAG: cation-transporting P-type ATPase [Proteobacteria bacterium]|nr:cation-transporting P-type ATPase [Pseudomonadota bacterium]NOG60015.1 cation-transporting P-type ATPase [Pseudomonadota bacterium]
MIMSDWYHKDIETVFEELSSSSKGLGVDEAKRRLSENGYNRISEKKRTSPVKRFLLQFHNFLIYILIAAAGITAALNEWIDASVIIGVVIINAVIGYLQESKAEAALASLKKMLSLQATIIREGRQFTIPAENLVIGDVVLISSGDRIPADLRLFNSRNLHIDEATLTGESLPVSKHTQAIEEQAEIADKTNMIFSGTFVTSGQGIGIVTETGDNTELGKIAGMLQSIENVVTPLTRQLASFSKTLTIIIIIGCLAVYAFGTLVQELPSIDVFMIAVAIAVSAIPEGLPAIMTITLAIGVTRMVDRNAIIRKLPAVETLGSTRIICTDKTGTLTRNEMTVTRIINAESDFTINGIGYAPTGTISCNNEQIDIENYPALLFLLRAGLLCNEASLKHKNNEWHIEGDPTEAALLVAARKALLGHEDEKTKYPRDDSIPFESEQQYMATLNHDHFGNGYIFLKGAPERIIELCDSLEGENQGELIKREWIDRAREVASDGSRVLAITYKPVSQQQEVLSFSDIEQGGFIFLGLTGMLDPVRQEALEALVACKEAGINVKMITGDHAQTAKSVAKKMNLGDEVITGVELDQLSESEFQQVANRVNVFARVSPEHKLGLVRALQNQGEVVAMTGDGVNDAPALKQADIGIAMGITGTEVSKDAADMVITDDNFASIANAVEEGRTVFNNLKKTIMFILPTNGGECLIIIWAIIVGGLLPVLPLHILWINMITTVALAITLAFEPVEEGTMKVPPRIPDSALIEPALLWRIVLVSVVMALGTYGLFIYETTQGASTNEARTVAVNTIVFFEILYIFNTRYLKKNVLGIKGLFGNKVILIGVVAVIIFQLLFTYTSLCQQLFKTAPIAMSSWLNILLVSFGLFFIVEVEKLIVNLFQNKFVNVKP